MYAVECVEECKQADGTIVHVGDIIIDTNGWMLCMPGFRNAAARFRPADAETTEKVAEMLADRQPVVDATRAYLQTKIDEIAATGKLAIDPATGFFRRDAAGTFPGCSKLAVHLIETAAGHGLTPKVLPQVAVDPPTVTMTVPAVPEQEPAAVFVAEAVTAAPADEPDEA